MPDDKPVAELVKRRTCGAVGFILLMTRASQIIVGLLPRTLYDEKVIDRNLRVPGEDREWWIDKYPDEVPTLFLHHLFGSNSLLQQFNLSHHSYLPDPFDSSSSIGQQSFKFISLSSLHPLLHSALLFRIRQTRKHVGPSRNPPSLSSH